ncbi:MULTISPECIES: hypothetical protein [unclassified Rickettsia]
MQQSPHLLAMTVFFVTISSHATRSLVARNDDLHFIPETMYRP